MCCAQRPSVIALLDPGKRIRKRKVELCTATCMSGVVKAENPYLRMRNRADDQTKRMRMLLLPIRTLVSRDILITTLNFRASSRLPFVRDMATTISAPSALAKRRPKWRRPPMPTMQTRMPFLQPYFFRDAYRVMPPQSIGPAGSRRRSAPARASSRRSCRTLCRRSRTAPDT